MNNDTDQKPRELPIDYEICWSAKFGTAQVSVSGDCRLEYVRDQIKSSQDVLSAAVTEARESALFKKTLAATAEKIAPEVLSILHEKLLGRERDSEEDDSLLLFESQIGTAIARGCKVTFSMSDDGNDFIVQISSTDSLVSVRDHYLRAAMSRAFQRHEEEPE